MRKFQTNIAIDLLETFAKCLTIQRIVPNDGIFDYVKE